MTNEWINTISNRYIELFEKVIGKKFIPEELSNEETFDRISKALKQLTS